MRAVRGAGGVRDDADGSAEVIRGLMESVDVIGPVAGETFG
jgi:hypothetical protein